MHISTRMVRVALSAAAVVLVQPAFSAVKIQELFDNAALNAPLNGQGNFNGTSVGFLSGSVWTANPGYAGAANTIFTANNFNVAGVPGPSPDAGVLGGIWRAGSNDFNTQIWASRALSASTSVNLATDGVQYFSFRLDNLSDTAVGFGFSNGISASSEFIGWGAHWNNQIDLNNVEARNSLYLTGGTLGQDLFGNNNGVYAMLQHTAEGSINGSAFVVGKITSSATGTDLVNVKMYLPGSTISTDPDNLAWDLTNSLSSSANLDQMLVWVNGAGQGQVDAIRVGETWTDVTGVVPEPASAGLLALGSLLALGRRRRAQA